MAAARHTVVMGGRENRWGNNRLKSSFRGLLHQLDLSPEDPQTQPESKFKYESYDSFSVLVAQKKSNVSSFK